MRCEKCGRSVPDEELTEITDEIPDAADPDVRVCGFCASREEAWGSCFDVVVSSDDVMGNGQPLT